MEQASQATGTPQPKKADPKVETSMRATALFGLVVFALLFFAGGAWLYFADLAGAIVTTGSVNVAGRAKDIQHLDGGIVKTISVKDGDRVKSGAVMVQLDDTLLRANLQILERRLVEESARRARLVAERDGLDKITWEDDLLKLFHVAENQQVKQSQLRLFKARIASSQGQVEQLKEKSRQYANQSEGVEAQRKSNLAQVKLLDEELAGLQNLLTQGLVRISQVKALERQRESIHGRYAELGSSLAQVQNAVNELNIKILQIDRDFRTQVLTELRDVDQSINEVTQRLYATREQLNRVDIKAPVDGIVHEMQLSTIGGVIGPGATIAQIIPQNEYFEILAQLDPRFVDNVHQGQAARLVFTAFNQRSTPNLSATVRQVSANIVTDESSGVVYYRVSLDVTQQELAKLGEKQLLPGMPIEVFIETGERSALSYLMKPIIDNFNRSLTEE